MDKKKTKELPDLAAIETPDSEVPKTSWTKEEKCAYIWNEIRRAGHPDLINKKEISRRLECGYSTVYYYLDNVVYPYMEQNAAKNHISVSNNVYQLAVSQLLAEGEWEKAAKVNKMWNEWLSDRGMAEKAPDRHVFERGDLDAEDKAFLEDLF